MTPLVEGVKAHTRLVIPNLHDSKVITRDDMRLVWVTAEVYAVDSSFVPSKGVVGCCFLRPDCPDFDFLVQRGRSEHRGILRIDSKLHYVVVVVLVRVNYLPVFIPVVHFDRVVIGTGEHVRLRRVYHNVSNVVSMLIYHLYFLGSVVVENPNFVVICTHNKPLFTCYKFCAPYWRISNIKSPYRSLGIIVVNYNASSVECDDNPRQGWVKVDGFDSFGSVEKLLFYL